MPSAALRAANRALLDRTPGERPGQPVHVIYGGAHLYRADAARRLAEHARLALESWAPTPELLAEAFGLDPALAARVHPRVHARLAGTPVEDQRVDFEDGYGVRPDDEEDAHVDHVATELGRGAAEGWLPPSIGIRVKPLSEACAPRALRTLRRFLERSPTLPPGFVVTLAKPTVPEQVAALVDELPDGVPVELMVEAPQALSGPDGRCPLPELVAAGRGRVRACHLGAYDLTAALGVPAAAQSLRHPAAEHARQVMALALAGTGVWVADGATTTLPVPPHKAAPPGTPEAAANRRVVHDAWRRHAEDVRHGLETGFPQGWDLHPAQLVSRYVAVYAFYQSALPDAARRLRAFVDRVAQATRVGTTFDDAATGQGLLNFFLRGLDSGALTAEEAASGGVGAAALRAREFGAVGRE